MFSKKFYYAIFLLVLPLLILINYDFYPVLKVKFSGIEKEFVIAGKKINRMNYFCGKGYQRDSTCVDLTHVFYVTDTSSGPTIFEVEVSAGAYDSLIIGDKAKFTYLRDDPNAPMVLSGFMTKSELKFYLTAMLGLVFIMIGYFYKRNESFLRNCYKKFFKSI